MVCVILAAGKNLRLNLGLPKSFLTINGQSLMERHIEQFQKLGFTKFAVITGYHRKALEETVPEIAAKLNASVALIYNEKYELENGYSLYTAKEWIQSLGREEFFFTMADHYYETQFLKEFLSDRSFKKGEILRLAVDTPGDHNKHIDLDDVTKVRVEDSIIKEIGKDLTTYNYYDTGLFHVKNEVFETLNHIAKNHKLSISNMVTYLAGEERAQVVEINGLYWNDIDTPEDFKSSKSILEKNPSRQ